MALKRYHKKGVLEAGTDEAGRGALAGPVVAAAVILPNSYRNSALNDSKKVTASLRYELRDEIINKAIAWAVAYTDNKEIDKINILRATFLTMHKALAALATEPQFILVDGPYFIPYKSIPYLTVKKGDGIYNSIAAASILAKTFRDDLMKDLAAENPGYGWETNMGYGTAEHRDAIVKLGCTSYHRLSFRLTDPQLELLL